MADLGTRTWNQMRELDASGGGDWVALLPVGAIEAHGPHLPLATDGWIAEAMAHRAADRLRREGVEALVLPVHNYTPAGFAAGFEGTVDADPTVVEGVIAASAAAVDRAGGALLVIVNAHFDPANVEAIRGAVKRIAGSPAKTRVHFFDLTRRRHAQRIGGEFATGACHAGRYEGSLMLALRPDLVDLEAARGLPPYPRSLVEGIAAGASSFEDLGGADAYFGWPAEADASEGERTLELIGQIAAEEIQHELENAETGGKP